MKREALQPAQHLPCSTHPLTQLAGTRGEEHDIFYPKNPQLECKSPAEASNHTILQKNLFYEFHSQLRAGIAASKEGTSPLGGPGRAGGFLCKWRMILLIAQELSVKILPWPFLLNLGPAPIFSPWHVINAHYHQDPM